MSLVATDMNKSTVLGDIQTRNRFLEFRFMSKQCCHRISPWSILNVYLSYQCFTDSPGTSGIFLNQETNWYCFNPFSMMSTVEICQSYIFLIFLWNTWSLLKSSKQQPQGERPIGDWWQGRRKTRESSTFGTELFVRQLTMHWVCMKLVCIFLQWNYEYYTQPLLLDNTANINTVSAKSCIVTVYFANTVIVLFICRIDFLAEFWFRGKQF